MIDLTLSVLVVMKLISSKLVNVTHTLDLIGNQVPAVSLYYPLRHFIYARGGEVFG